MKAIIKIVDPHSVEASITFTMTVEKWLALRKAMDGQPFYGAAQQVRDAVDELVKRIARTIDYSPCDDCSATSASGGDHG